MGKIFCLIGKSSSGKDSIFNRLKEDKDLNLKPVISYTTRPKRNNETNGVEYYFINEEILDESTMTGKVIEKREYDTINGKWVYCTIDNDQFNLEKENYIAIVTLEAYKSFQSYFGSDKVFPVYISVDDGVRLGRALGRERKQEYPNYDEMCRRFLADGIDFSSDELNNTGIKKHYNNNNLEECIENIKQDIIKFI
jgi:guanylate kinase